MKGKEKEKGERHGERKKRNKGIKVEGKGMKESKERMKEVKLIKRKRERKHRRDEINKTNKVNKDTRFSSRIIVEKKNNNRK